MSGQQGVLARVAGRGGGGAKPRAPRLGAGADLADLRHVAELVRLARLALVKSAARRGLPARRSDRRSLATQALGRLFGDPPRPPRELLQRRGGEKSSARALARASVARRLASRAARAGLVRLGVEGDRVVACRAGSARQGARSGAPVRIVREQSRTLFGALADPAGEPTARTRQQS
ncbi:MAG: hypothetical protein GEU90_17765 [Gemmatimonas sp.]|nr:hypothetical protein [Gemmatimonas sp.]